MLDIGRVNNLAPHPTSLTPDGRRGGFEFQGGARLSIFRFDRGIRQTFRALSITPTRIYDPVEVYAPPRPFFSFSTINYQPITSTLSPLLFISRSARLARLMCSRSDCTFSSRILNLRRGII